jgi:FtsH-binding integral membrane protein
MQMKSCRTINPEEIMIPVKIQCSCGQRYAFDIEPVCGRMTSSVACPVCGTDGTTVANEVIAFTLASELSRHGSGKENVMVFAVIGCLIAGIVGIIKAFNMVSGIDVLLCLLGAIVAFGTALCVYFLKR